MYNSIAFLSPTVVLNMYSDTCCDCGSCIVLSSGSLIDARVLCKDYPSLTFISADFVMMLSFTTSPSLCLMGDALFARC